MKTIAKKLWLLSLLLIAIECPTFGQSTATFTGTVVDPTGAAVDGAAVTATNTRTGLARTTVTNGDGLYTITALDPGIYDVKAENAGFAASAKSGVNLIVGTRLTLDFSLSIAGTIQHVEVQGGSTAIDTTQSVVTASIETDQLQDLPIINRNMTGLVELLPGARPVTPNPTKQSMGAVTFSGAGEFGLSTVDVVADGGENRDLNIGGPNMNFSNEAIEEFTALNHEVPAEYAHGSGALNIVTKSGSNEFHGTAFGEGRSDAFTSIDYFTKQAGLSKTPYNREQYGGNFGGPVIKDKFFFFMALERPQYDQSVSIPSTVSSDMVALQTLDQLQNLGPVVGTNVVPATSIPQTYRDWLSDMKLNYTVNSAHSLFIRYAGQNGTSGNDQFNQTEFTLSHDLSAPSLNQNSLYSVVGGWTWIISPTKLNRVTFQRLHYRGDIDSSRIGTTEDNLNFPTFSAGRTYIRQLNIEDTIEARDDFSVQKGKHALKFGVDFEYATSWGVFIYQPGFMNFFATPSAILSSYQDWQANPSGCTSITCGLYPNGLETVGAVSLIVETSSVLGGGHVPHSSQWGFYAQDDWKIKPRLTLNFGLRYDISPNFYNSTTMRKSRVLQVLEAINSPYAGVVGTPKLDIGPRVGFAWDIRGDGKHVLRGGAGLFFSQGSILNSFEASSLGQPVLFLASGFANTGAPGQPGPGIFSTYQYGITPLPAITEQPTSLPVSGGTTGNWQDPKSTDPYTEQFHIGYAWQISGRTSIQADYTHYLGLHGLVLNQEINPIEGAWDPSDADHHIPWGQRRLEPQLVAIGQPNILGSIPMANTTNRDRYDELAVQFQHRFTKDTVLHVNYAYSRSYSYFDAQALVPQDQDHVISPENWGPQTNDQPHSLSVFAVFNLPAGIQLSPILQAASGRPYTLTQGVDLNQDGVNNDRYVPCGNPSACAAVGPDSERGKTLFLLDLRGTKFFNLGKEGKRKIGVYVEGYNLTNRANFGNTYSGNCAAILVNGLYQCSNTNFEKPTGFIPGLGYTRQMQLGARFIF